MKCLGREIDYFYIYIYIYIYIRPMNFKCFSAKLLIVSADILNISFKINASYYFFWRPTHSTNTHTYIYIYIWCHLIIAAKTVAVSIPKPSSRDNSEVNGSSAIETKNIITTDWRRSCNTSKYHLTLSAFLTPYDNVWFM